jgi:hypothetical protein
MKCEEAAEFVSAIYNGERIPRSAAEHVGRCETCHCRLKEYVEIGAELRLVASLELSEESGCGGWAEFQPRNWESARPHAGKGIGSIHPARCTATNLFPFPCNYLTPRQA